MAKVLKTDEIKKIYYFCRICLTLLSNFLKMATEIQETLSTGQKLFKTAKSVLDKLREKPLEETDTISLK